MASGKTIKNLGMATSVLGVFAVIIVGIVLGFMQGFGVINIGFAWWIVIVLAMPLMLLVGMFISLAGDRRIKREEAAVRNELAADNIARREYRAAVARELRERGI